VAQAKYQVFISSTFGDLQEERNQVIRAVLEMGHIPVGMEMFSAADEEQWQIIARHIDESDYYAVIVAHRYGSTTGEAISYTRKEYEYALSRGVPCLGFVIEDNARWPADRVDSGADKTALDLFKALVREKPISFWTSADDLHGKFSIALMKAITSRPREGWIRASSASGPEVTSEVVRLSAENAALRQELARAKAAAEEGHLQQVREIVDTLRHTERTFSYRDTPGEPWKTATVPLLRAFGAIVAELVVESTVENLASILCMNVRESGGNQWNIVAINQVKTLMADFMALDLVRPSVRRHAVSDPHEYWSLAPFGVEVHNDVRRRWVFAPKDQEPVSDDQPSNGPDHSAQNTDQVQAQGAP
jgi:hypothetical protein